MKTKWHTYINGGIVGKLRDLNGIVTGTTGAMCPTTPPPQSALPSPGCADPSVVWRQWQFSEGGTAPNTGLLGKGPFDKWHMSFCQERRVGPWCMTVLRSWGNRLFGMERLSLFFLSLFLSCYPSSGHHQKRPKCCVGARGSRRTGRPFFLFSCSHFLSLYHPILGRGNKPTKKRKGKKHMYEKEKDNC